MMKSLKILRIIVVSAVCCGALATPAHAWSGPWFLDWWDSHEENTDFEPYLEAGKHPHNGQWDNSPWRPEHWVAQRKNAQALMDGFYRADILRGQYTEDDVPVLEVGPGFYMLGGQDKRRVAETVDYLYQITARNENGMFMLVDWDTEEPVGSYTRHGLSLQ